MGIKCNWIENRIIFTLITRNYQYKNDLLSLKTKESQIPPTLPSMRLRTHTSIVNHNIRYLPKKIQELYEICKIITDKSIVYF